MNKYVLNLSLPPNTELAIYFYDINMIIFMFLDNF